jgi:hypothetical protein
LILSDTILLSCDEPLVYIPWPSTIRYVTGNILEGAGFVAGRAFIRRGISPECVSAI